MPWFASPIKPIVIVCGCVTGAARSASHRFFCKHGRSDPSRNKTHLPFRQDVSCKGWGPSWASTIAWVSHHLVLVLRRSTEPGRMATSVLLFEIALDDRSGYSAHSPLGGDGDAGCLPAAVIAGVQSLLLG